MVSAITVEEGASIGVPFPSSDRPTFIYALCETDGTVRYVGKTVRLRPRYQAHIAESKTEKKTHKNNWVRSVMRSGVQPIMVELECVPPYGDWVSAERRWIKYYLELGFVLTNLADGGAGPTGFVQSAETRAKRGAAQRGHQRCLGHKLSGEHKAKIGAASLGKLHTPEAKEKISASKRGRKHTPEAIEKMRNAQLGKARSPEARAKTSASLMGNQWCLGYKHSDETKAKMREAQLRRHARERAERLTTDGI